MAEKAKALLAKAAGQEAQKAQKAAAHLLEEVLEVKPMNKPQPIKTSELVKAGSEVLIYVNQKIQEELWLLKKTIAVGLGPEIPVQEIPTKINQCI